TLVECALVVRLDVRASGEGTAIEADRKARKLEDRGAIGDEQRLDFRVDPGLSVLLVDAVPDDHLVLGVRADVERREQLVELDAADVREEFGQLEVVE